MDYVETFGDFEMLDYIPSDHPLENGVGEFANQKVSKIKKNQFFLWWTLESKNININIFVNKVLFCIKFERAAKTCTNIYITIFSQPRYIPPSQCPWHIEDNIFYLHDVREASSPV